MIRGSAKNLIQTGDDSPYAVWYERPTSDTFGKGVFQAHGGFSVRDLKEEIPFTVIPCKAKVLAMMTAYFFERLAERCPDVDTTYIAIMDKDGKPTTVDKLIKKGDTSDAILMKIAHTPDSYLGHVRDNNDRIMQYRKALASGQLLCGVGDVESIFRRMLPLGSSVFKKIFEAAGFGSEYDSMVTYSQVVEGLNRIGALNVLDGGDGHSELGTKWKDVKAVLEANGLSSMPYPGTLLSKVRYNTTTKFEVAGDRDIPEEIARKYSGLSRDQYDRWKADIFPRVAETQIKLLTERGSLNADGKVEVVAYHGRPYLTDWACNTDENRPMIIVEREGATWGLPTNKELQRIIFKGEGVDSAIREAKGRAEKDGKKNEWKGYFREVCEERKLDIRAIAEKTVTLMGNAGMEIANRTLGNRVFDVPALETWVNELMPYASKTPVRFEYIS